MGSKGKCRPAGVTRKTGQARHAHPHAPRAGKPRSHDDEPLNFFTGGQDRRGDLRKTLVVAAAAGLLVGLTTVGVYAGLSRDAASGRPALTARAGQQDFLWQRPVIGTKSDLEGEMTQATSAAATPVATSSTSSLPPVERPLEEAAIPLMTGFAAAEGRATGIPSILQASLVIPGDSAANETVIAKTPPPEPVDADFTLGKGDTVAGKLIALGIAPETARALVRAMEPVYPSRLLRAGQKFSVTLDRQQDFYGSDVIYPVYLSFSPRKGRKIVVESDEDGHFVASEKGQKRLAGTRPSRSARKAGGARHPAPEKARVTPRGFVHARARVTSSLYASARDQHIPAYIISQMLRAFSYDLDLQRQVAKGDVFEVLYGPPLSGSSRRRKVLYYAAVNTRSGKKVYYRYTTPHGRTAYFDPRGRSAIKGLMHTPVSGARITSGFGMRRHPILGYSKMHTGVDFGAPRGTPIHAAGNGVITYAAWRGGYGRAIMIRHDNGYVTLYAHQSRFARGIRKGVRVRQGQVIGYVGSTGRSTGPHLHFEVRINNRPVNPLHVRTSTRIRLKGKALKLFRKRMARINALLRQAPAPALVARN